MLNTFPLHDAPLHGETSPVEASGSLQSPPVAQVAMPLDPSWPPSGETYRVTRSYQTEVITTRDGREYRLSRRDFPRTQIQFALVLIYERLRQFKDLLWSAQPREIALPALQERTPLPAELPAGSDSLELDSLPGWLRPGATVILDSVSGREHLEVSAVEDDVVYFAAPTQHSHPAGAPLLLGLVGNLEAMIDADRETTTVATAQITFTVRPLSEAAPEEQAADTTYAGREVFLRKPNWAQSVGSKLGHDVDELDYELGPTYRYVAVPFGFEITQGTYLNRDVAEAQALEAFFHRMRGQQGEFWMPTWEPDFRVTGLESSALLAAGTDVADHYRGSLTHKVVFLHLASGDVVLRRVTALTVVAGDTRIALDVALPPGLAIADIVIAGWTLLRRLASDSLTVEWVTNSVANVQFSMRTLEVLDAET